jgi:hypothetical protein
MGRIPHSWQEAYALAFKESDPDKLIGRIEYALIAIERRYSEWETYPGTPAELRAIQKCIAALQRLMSSKHLGTSLALVRTLPVETQKRRSTA